MLMVSMTMLNFEVTLGDPRRARALGPTLHEMCVQLEAIEFTRWVRFLLSLSGLLADIPLQDVITELESSVQAARSAGRHYDAATCQLFLGVAWGLAESPEAAQAHWEELQSWPNLPSWLPATLSVYRCLFFLISEDREQAAAHRPTADTLHPDQQLLLDAAFAGDVVSPGSIPSRSLAMRVGQMLVEKIATQSPHLTVAADGSWFALGGAAPVKMGRRGPARRILLELTRAHVSACSAEALIEAGWPGQRILPESARMRLHTAIRTLRTLGLDTHIETVEGGYRLRPQLSVSMQ